VTRGVAAALGIWTVVATVWAVFFSGGRVLECLGGPAITVDDCRAAYGLPPETGPTDSSRDLESLSLRSSSAG
jgi:hypothetical protein